MSAEHNSPPKAVSSLAWQQFLPHLPPQLQEFIHHLEPKLATSLQEQIQLAPQAWLNLLLSSNQALQILTQQPDLLLQLQQQGRLQPQPLAKSAYQTWCQEIIGAKCTNEAELMQALRRLRQAAMLRYLWLDAQANAVNLTPPADLTPAPQDTAQQVWHTAAEVSLLAEVISEAALSWLEDFYAPAWGRACSGTAANSAFNSQPGAPVRLVVLGMGKLGAGELNLSSDIDLIFAYASPGATQGGRRSLDNQEYFTRLGQKLITLLDKTTAAGLVFRVDMRLRPYGDAGALALSFNALLDYYQQQGRDWERYALIKARVIAGDTAAGTQLLAQLRPFVYRRYLDFSALEALRSLKAKINQETSHQQLASNIKLGPGGIREVEFIAQVLQLIRGGRNLSLQTTSTRQALKALAQLQILAPALADQLLHAYAQLRDLEHALQGMDDKQTQTLPTLELTQARLAWRCGYTSWAELTQQLELNRNLIRQQFNALIAAPNSVPEQPRQLAATLGNLDSPAGLDTSTQAQQALHQAGFQQPAATLEQLQRLYTSHSYTKMQPLAKQRLEQLMPQLLQAVASSSQPDLALTRSLWLIEAVLRRSAYLVLLTENPNSLQQLVNLCAASPWLAEQLAKMPVLLDELLQPTNWQPATLPNASSLKSTLADELRQHTSRLAQEDIEAHMEAQRYFRHAQVLRVAAADLLANLPLMQVSDYLTYLAEVLLNAVMHLAWQDLSRRHGSPQASFIIVGYGKLGGLEMGYSSDLDLVFIHSGDSTQTTQGPKPLDTSTWFSRLGQRIIHYLTTATASGQLYEVDLRLRPSGNSGLLVSSWQAFAAYQSQNAWVWEHQALARARIVASHTSDPSQLDAASSLTAQFNSLRAQILSRPRALPQLREAVINMREKMHTQQANSPDATTNLHLKYGRGGLVDIEFLTQYLVLAHAQHHPQLYEFSDTLRMLDALAATAILSTSQAQGLQQAYLAYRQAIHRADLSQTSLWVAAANWQPQLQLVQQLWQKFLYPA